MSQRPAVLNANKIAIPTQPYVCRVENYTFKKTQKGDPMSVIECAIAAPESFEHDGNNIPVAGRKFRINMIWNDAETWGTQAAWELLDKLGFKESSFEPDPTKSADSAFFQGMYFRAVLKSEASYHTTDGSYYNKKTPEHLVQKDTSGNKLLREYTVVCNSSDIIGACSPEGDVF